MKKTEFTALLLDRCATALWYGKMKMESSIADRDFSASIISALCEAKNDAANIYSSNYEEYMEIWDALEAL